MDVNIGRDIVLDVDVDRLAPNVMEHVVYIGLRNILMDAHAAATKVNGATVDDARALSEKKLDAMYRGEVRTQSTRTGDPVAKEVRHMAAAIVEKAVRARGKKPADVDMTAIVNAYIAKHPELREKAKAAVEDRAALVKSVDIDL